MTYLDPRLPLAPLLPIRSLVVALENLHEARPAFFHQPALTAWLRTLAGPDRDFETRIRIDALESGRILYRPGDRYRFSLLNFGPSCELVDKLLQRLQGLPGSARRRDAHGAFSSNWRLLSIHDAFTETPIESLHEAALYDEQTLDEEAILWREQPRIGWRWLSPARLYKAKQARIDQTGEARYCRDAADLDAPLLLNRVYDAIAAWLRNAGTTDLPARSEPPQARVSDAHLFWLDADYHQPDGKSTPIGGMSGAFQLGFDPAPSLAWCRLLVLGQFLGVGQRAAFGWGRYRLETMAQGFTYRRPRAASTLLAQAAMDENLAAAWRHVMTGADWPLDEEEALAWERESADPSSDDASAPIDKLQRDLGRLERGEYRVPDLYGTLIPKRNGGMRALAVPPAYDRVLQRAVAQVLTPALDQLMYPRSHGYRRGHSRITASYDVQAAWRSGYRWVFESDIKDFFDSVDLGRLEQRLRSLYDEDPVIECVLDWMRAAVRYQGERIERHTGVPQGSPLSPLMANLILDDFDGDMAAAGFRLIRFADDFIVLCRDPSEAQRAATRAAESLAEHGFELHPDKTRTTQMDEGFRYLGYLFVNDMALDVSGACKPVDVDELSVSPNSWLARIGEHEARPLDSEAALEAVALQLASGDAISIGERSRHGAMLTVTGEPSVLSTLNKNVRVHRGTKLIHNQPWRDLRGIILFGRHQLTTQAMHEAMRHRVAVHFATGWGRYEGALWSGQGPQGHSLWLHQLAAFTDPDKALYLSRAVVGARLRHVKEVLRGREKGWDAAIIDDAIRQHTRSPSLESLRGL
ncbi:MAG: CRISPR-associated endonuclease Cas1, partial [Gammaproteobacteria bacterium]|nr:CRISPR-associated endonuclease Cas1 [Gammaproteobacteria bacterium]